MNKNKIVNNYPGGYTKWESDNKDLIATEIMVASSTCTHQKCIVELSGFDKPSELLQWLRDNTGFICFDESLKYIQSSHTVSINRSSIDEQIDEQIMNLVNGDVTKPNALKISLSAIMDDFKIDFDSYDYEKMLKVQLTLGSVYKYDLNITYEDTLVNGNVYFSAPFFRSIIKVNNVTDFKNCIFYFAAIKVDGRDSIGFKVAYFNNTIAGFYDYSTIPGTGTGGGSGISLHNNTKQVINYL